jgi:hypothetical protein
LLWRCGICTSLSSFFSSHRPLQRIARTKPSTVSHSPLDFCSRIRTHSGHGIPGDFGLELQTAAALPRSPSPLQAIGLKSYSWPRGDVVPSA